MQTTPGNISHIEIWKGENTEAKDAIISLKKLKNQTN